MDFLLSILSSIIGNLLTPDLKKWMGLKPNLSNPPLPTLNIDSLDSSDDDGLEQRRAYLRQKREILSWTIMVYFVLLFFVGAALVLPLAFKTSFFSKPLECDTILLASMCTGYYWQPKLVIFLLAQLVVIFSVAIFLFSQFFASPIASYIHLNHTHVSPILYRRILSLSIMFLAMLLCGHWIYFLYPSQGYFTSVLWPFMLFGMMWVFDPKRR